ncbi:primase C-terminal domain-containing protein [Metabacillus fastidiosus]|uniref:primase C-terminal domain-containing protein n=1 Tax=Metabacillus fastidiosus TaxID=1458 RepID=UPI002E212D10|nr:primase C-terminal domain-containing protein [Metabacillus fastidiosus]
MNALKSIFGDQLTIAAKKKSEKEQTGHSTHLGWVFVTDDFKQNKAVRTYRSLFGMEKAYTYFTPNTFYRNDKRKANSLRWINAVSVDIDVKNGQNTDLTLPDVLDSVTASGLPEPSLIVQTPSGGFHIHWFLDAPKRAFKKVIKHYARIQRAIAEAINGDNQAIGAERWFRMPNEENTIYQSAERVSFDSLCDWYSIQLEDWIAEYEERKNNMSVNATNILLQPAIQKLLKGVEQGRRDNTCYTLALAFKAAGYDAAATERKLHEWNTKNDPAMREIDIKRKVKSAFKKGAPAGPSAYFIRTLSGMPFTYQVWEEAKERHERKYSHYSEWEEDVLAYIKKHGGELSGSQRSLAEEITSSANRKQTISYSTFKEVINRLADSGRIVKTVEGKGRGAVTTLTIQEQTNVIEMPSQQSSEQEEEVIKNNGLNSNTFIDQAVGGSALVPVASSLLETTLPKDNTYTNSSFAPIPKNVPDRFVSLLWNRGFRDGRFIFAAWGRIQLAFKAFGISFKDLSHKVYLDMISEAVSITVGKKGSNFSGDFSNFDGFYKYLFGTMKGLISTYREQELEDFREEIEGLGLIELLDIGCGLEEEFYADNCIDRELVREKLIELQSQQTVAKRRAHRQKLQEQGRKTVLDLFADYLNK